MPSIPDDDAIVLRAMALTVGAFAIALGPMAHQWLTAQDQRRMGGRAALHEP